MVIRHLVMYSGGLCSYVEAKLVVEKYGTDGVVLLFADTKMEDPDLYRFLDESSANVGASLVRIAHGMTPWELMRQQGVIAKSGLDLCSATLKRDLLNKWRKDNCDPDVTTTYFGLTHYETPRLKRVQLRHVPWKCASLVSEESNMDRGSMIELAQGQGLKIPRLYDLGFPHNNCGGFCVKAGVRWLKHLYDKLPEVYLEMEYQEKETIRVVEKKRGKKHFIFSVVRSGETIPVTLESLRVQWQSSPGLFDDDSCPGGGCGCAVD